MENETKLCKYCKTEIPKKAKVCPNCHKKQSGILKWIIIGVVVIGLIATVAGGGEDKKESTGQQTVSENNKNNKDKKEEASDNDDNDDNDDTEDSKKDKEEGDNVLTVGSSFEKGGLKITVDDASLNYKDYDDEYNMYTPKKGKKYIMASFIFENSGKTDAYVSIYDFECYADNVACEQAYLPDDNDFINTNLSSGRSVSFKAYYEVPKKAKTIELEYETSFWTDAKAIIKLK